MKMATAQNNSKRGAGVFINWSSKYSGGDPPERMVFRQRCGNKACCNLMHLALFSPYIESV